MTEKEIFINKLRNRTKKFAVDIINFCSSLEKNPATSVIIYRLIKSATSIGANYRAACRARSKVEFFSKICIVVEKADETEYWLEIIEEINIQFDNNEFERLKGEASEITKIMAKSKKISISKKVTLYTYHNVNYSLIHSFTHSLILTLPPHEIRPHKKKTRNCF